MDPKISIQKRIRNQKVLFLEKLKETPIVELVCKKLGVGRTTYYRWRQQDHEFAKAADEAILAGSLIINDMAESQLISAIKDKNLGAIIFWLRHHHPTYTNKIEVTARLKHDEKLTPDQEALIDKALKLAALVPTIKNLKDEELKKI